MTTNCTIGLQLCGSRSIQRLPSGDLLCRAGDRLAPVLAPAAPWHPLRGLCQWCPYDDSSVICLALVDDVLSVHHCTPESEIMLHSVDGVSEDSTLCLSADSYSETIVVSIDNTILCITNAFTSLRILSLTLPAPATALTAAPAHTLAATAAGSFVISDGCIHVIDCGVQTAPLAAAVAHGGSFLAATAAGTLVQVAATAGGAGWRVEKWVDLKMERGTSIALSGDRVVVGGAGAIVRVFSVDLAYQTTLARVQARDGAHPSVEAIAPTDEGAVMLYSDGTLAEWSNGKEKILSVGRAGCVVRRVVEYEGVLALLESKVLLGTGARQMEDAIDVVVTGEHLAVLSRSSLGLYNRDLELVDEVELAGEAWPGFTVATNPLDFGVIVSTSDAEFALQIPSSVISLPFRPLGPVAAAGGGHIVCSVDGLVHVGSGGCRPLPGPAPVAWDVDARGLFVASVCRGVLRLIDAQDLTVLSRLSVSSDVTDLVVMPGGSRAMLYSSSTQHVTVVSLLTGEVLLDVVSPSGAAPGKDGVFTSGAGTTWGEGRCAAWPPPPPLVPLMQDENDFLARMRGSAGEDTLEGAGEGDEGELGEDEDEDMKSVDEGSQNDDEPLHETEIFTQSESQLSLDPLESHEPSVIEAPEEPSLLAPPAPSAPPLTAPAPTALSALASSVQSAVTALTLLESGVPGGLAASASFTTDDGTMAPPSALRETLRSVYDMLTPMFGTGPREEEVGALLAEFAGRMQGLYRR